MTAARKELGLGWPATRFASGTLSPTLGFHIGSLREGSLQARPSRPACPGSGPPAPLQPAPASRLGPARQAGLSLRTGSPFSHPRSGPATQPTRMRHRLHGNHVPPYSGARSLAARASKTAATGPLAALQHAGTCQSCIGLRLTNRHLCGLHTSCTPGQRLRGRPTSATRGPDLLPGTGARDQVSSTAPSRQAIRWGQGSPNPPSLLSGRG